MAKLLTARWAEPGSATPGGAQTFGGGRSLAAAAGSPAGAVQPGAADAAHSVTGSPHRAGHRRAVILAVVLAIAGGLIAGSFGGWRAARLRPAAALARVE